MLDHLLRRRSARVPSLKNCFPSWIYLPPQLEFHHDDVVITSSGTEQIDLRTWKFVYQGRGYAVQILLLKVIELFELQSGTFSRKRRTDGDNCRGTNPRMRANPMNRTDSWRVTLPLAQAAAALWRTEPGWRTLPVTSYGERSVSPAWRPVHWRATWRETRHVAARPMVD
jgi:hypothetical protein